MKSFITQSYWQKEGTISLLEGNPVGMGPESHRLASLYLLRQGWAEGS